MYDFFDMVTLSVVTDGVVEALDDEHVNAALDFAHHVLSIAPLMLPLRITTCTQKKMPPFDLLNGF